MSNANVRGGDRGTTRQYRCDGTQDLAAFANHMHALLWQNRPFAEATLPVTILDPVTRTVEVDFGTDPTDWLPSRPARGPWYLVVVGDIPGGDRFTWPEVTQGDPWNSSTETVTVGYEPPDP